LREAKGLSVRALARETDFSPSFISQVENGLAAPSIGSMGRIAQALGVSLSDVFAQEPLAAMRQPGLEVVRSGEKAQFASSWSRGQLLLLQSRDRPGHLDPAILTLEATGQSSGRVAPSGHETFAFVLEGHVILHLDDQDVTLETADSALLSASLAHRWTNPFTSPARILLVSARTISSAG
jgi:transcriptional regulator with XRE-family HTH domain